MSDRKKLIELLHVGVCNYDCEECKYSISDDVCINHLEEMAADHLLANGVTFGKDTNAPTKWIPVTERLPEDGEIVLVCGSRSGVYTAVHNKPGCYRGWHKLNSKNHYCNPTHWMPLPEPPKEE